ncbi:D(2) dopamine receptor-like isoform X2 [Armigeres subalbatus]|uniref:D(2) dopamine receptor-like isoform X2 n=1 Tax=Armigeres subalbatus TaxID=124917 RepID=UPI002ED6B85F
MLPIAVLSKLIPTNQGHHKCRELWFNRGYERAYNLFLDVLLLVLPLLILAVTYSLITRTLCRGMHDFRRYSKALSTSTRSADGGVIKPSTTVASGLERSFRRHNNNNRVANDQYLEVYIRPNGSTKTRCPSIKCHRTASTAATSMAATAAVAVPASSTETMETTVPTGGGTTLSDTTLPGNDGVVSWNHHHSHPAELSPSSPFRSSTSVKGPNRLKNPALRKSNMEKSLTNKKRIIKMLFVVVLEFFICWTPLYVINTMALFWPSTVYHNLGYTAISFFQLLAYSSSCCNPITYCFMSGGFRKAFLNLFRCFRPCSGGGGSGTDGSGGIGRNRRNSSAMCGMYMASGCDSAGGIGTLLGKHRSSTSQRKQQQTKRTMDTILSTDGVVSLKHRDPAGVTTTTSARSESGSHHHHHRFCHHGQSQE